MLEPNSGSVEKSSDHAPVSVTAKDGTGFKGFNQVGREDATREVLRPQISSTARARNAAMIAVVLVLAGIVGFLAFRRSGLTFSTTPNNEKQFGPGSDSGAQ